MNKIKAFIFSILWTVIIIAFPVASGVIITVRNVDAIAARFIQAAFMYSSIAIPFLYCKIKKIMPKEILLTGINKSGIKKCLFFIPLIAVLAPMLAYGINLSGTAYVLATLLFTLGVGISEEIYFRGIILRLLHSNFKVLPTIFLSASIFGIGHASGAFVEKSPIMVLLSVFNAFLFGWVAVEIALIVKNIVPLMIFHCLFDFLTYQMLAAGDARIVIYAIRGMLMVIIAIYLLPWKQRSHDL